MNETFSGPLGGTYTFTDEGIKYWDGNKGTFYPYGCLLQLEMRLGKTLFLMTREGIERWMSYSGSDKKRLKNAIEFAQRASITAPKLPPEDITEEFKTVEDEITKAILEMDTEGLSAEEAELINELKEALNEEENKITEHRMRCNVCGQIFCYTDADLRKNQQYAKSALASSVTGLVGALGGFYAASATSQQSADQQSARIVDYSRCPNCKSTNLTDISREEIGGAKSENGNSQAQQKTANVAEELKQFKELLDMGIITQEEFDAKKKQLLGL